METHMIILNVRGIKYELEIDTFKSFPNTRLGRIGTELSGNKKTSELEKLCDKLVRSNEFYFNRDPFMLNWILNFYLVGKLHVSHADCANLIRNELEYWQIDESQLDNCCKMIYFEKIKKFEEEALFEEEIREKSSQRDRYQVRYYPKVRRKIWLLFTDPRSSILAKIVFIISMLNTFLAVIDLFIRTIPELKLNPDLKNEEKGSLSGVLDVLEPIYICWFLFELIIKFICTPNKKKFIQNYWNIIDLASILPFFIWLIISKYNISCQWKQIISISRVFLLLKINRNSSSLKSFIETIRISIKELGILFVYLSIGIMFFSSIVYYCENSRQPENFSSIPAAFWWGLVTMTTVGYGDVVPQTLLGKICGALCAVSGVLIVSLPIGIISAKFSQTLEKEQKTKLFLDVENKMNKIRKQITYLDSKIYSGVITFSNRKK